MNQEHCKRKRTQVKTVLSPMSNKGLAGVWEAGEDEWLCDGGLPP